MTNTNFKYHNFVSDALEEVQAMLTRPEMYAQNPGSLEDQVILLLRMINMDLQSDYHSWRGSIASPPWADFAEVTGHLRVYLRESSLFGEIIGEIEEHTGSTRNIR